MNQGWLFWVVRRQSVWLNESLLSLRFKKSTRALERENRLVAQSLEQAELIIGDHDRVISHIVDVN